AGLLALASVLGVGEGHLLHRETRWAGSRYFAKSESLFQSFPKELSYIPLQCQRLGEGPSRDARTQKNKDELT
ncbi:hypothetical protein KZ843_27705, partial [Pseudomonas aeruginosa]